MKVVYDPHIFSLQEFGGISRYFCALATQVSVMSDMKVNIVAPLYINEYLKEVNPGVRIGFHGRRPPKTGKIIKAVNDIIFRPISAFICPDVVHETYYSKYQTSGGKASRVLTVFDMIHEHYPDSFAVNERIDAIKLAAIRRADHIFCISENTRRDLLSLYPIPESKVSVTYLGYDELPKSEITAKQLVGDVPYILHVGGRSGYKNFANLLRAYAASAWLKSSVRIVCFGSAVISVSERILISELGLDSKAVVHIGGGDERLAALYRGAAAFVYPSQYEGFGIPPLEAMSLDCPVICSNSSSLPEVVGTAAEFFDPLHVDSIKVAIESVLQSPRRRNELIALGRQRCRTFSWKRCAQETSNVYRRFAA